MTALVRAQDMHQANEAGLKLTCQILLICDSKQQVKSHLSPMASQDLTFALDRLGFHTSIELLGGFRPLRFDIRSL